MSNYPNFKHYVFLDPAPSLTDLSIPMTDREFEERLIVIMGTKRPHSNPLDRVGEVVGLSRTSGRALTTSGTNGWFVDSTGQHVIGQLSYLPGSRIGEDHLLGLLDDGETWVLGEVTRYHSSTVNPQYNGWTIRPYGSSDGMTSPHGITASTRTRERVSKAFRAAPWAHELFPRFEDSPELVQVKLQLAEKNWNMRRAQYALHVQATYRNWTSMLPRLTEAGFPLPTPTNGVIVSGQALVEVQAPQEVRTTLRDLSPAAMQSDRMQEFRRRGATPGETIQTYSRIGFTMTLPLTGETTEATHRDISRGFSRLFNEDSPSLTSISQTRFVSGLARHATL